MRQILYSSKFVRSLRKMPKFVKKAFLEKEVLFLENPFHSLLDTHKLHGKYKSYLAFTVVGQYRIMFRIMEIKMILVLLTLEPIKFINKCLVK